ncbi:MarR family winged helix-turn-helix transcriptional regulator [Belliella aquatica]|uniref:MarR family transcriptional regulator n=1 Tax=Belliella aquatica TaxID=1323734 RepID=A0ABQ1MUT2_9BACT|nr:MarR family transcriptional regulator [Belliella aquatica]MCH7406166.1 MarR family transcriptional regulator [Belliella aquatica]GGC44739.1 MarR family transcriptional regulator [Belliella aquatica]
MRIEEAIKQKEFKDPFNKVVVNLLYTSSYIVSNQSSLFKPLALSPEQYNVLRILRGQNGKPITVSSIQDRMLNKMSNASRLVEKLKQKDFVVREECPSDRRQVDIMITDKGLAILKELESAVYDFNKQIVHLSEEETIQLNTLLDKLRG